MTADEFAKCCAQEKTELLTLYLNPDSGSSVALAIASLQLAPSQLEALKTILNTVLSDTFYTMLLALEGEASLGGKQIPYHLTDAEGNEITGQLEAAAWQHFHGEQS